MKHAGPADSWSYQPQRLQKWIGKVRPRWASSWTDQISPRPLWLDCPADEAIRGELQGEFYLSSRISMINE